jgi:hypothetical protein
MKYYGKELKLHEYIQEMKFLSKYPNVMSVSEGMIHLKPPKICGRRPKGIKSAYHFESVEIGSHIEHFGRNTKKCLHVTMKF